VLGRFTAGHLHALVGLLGNKGKIRPWAFHFGDVGARDRGSALQAWLSHLLGGKTRAPKAPTDSKTTTASKLLLNRAENSVTAAQNAVVAALKCVRRSCGADRARCRWRLIRRVINQEIGRISGIFEAAKPKGTPDGEAPRGGAAPKPASLEAMVWQLTVEVSAEQAHVVELKTELEAVHCESERAHRRERSAQAAFEAESAWVALQVTMLTQEQEVTRCAARNLPPSPLPGHLLTTPTPKKKMYLLNSLPPANSNSDTGGGMVTGGRD
jgi:hypothetical protein